MKILTRNRGNAVNMQHQGLNRGFYIADVFVEPLDGTLTRADAEPVHLEPKVMEVLLVLAGRNDRTVSRAELLDTVWRGQVAADELLTRAISELRRSLGDDPRSPVYIRTVPKRGYRFIGPVEPLAEVPESGTAVDSADVSLRRLPRFAMPAAVTAALVLGATLLAIDRVSLVAPDGIEGPAPDGAATTSSPVVVRSSPLTSMEGAEWRPALSPDGNYAAFVASPAGDFLTGNIYVVEVGSAMPVPLTADSGAGNRAPAWSPDGTRIAFARLLDEGRTDIVVKPMLGGFETRLATVGKFRGHDWSADGDVIAVASGEPGTSRTRIHLMSVSAGSMTPFTDPPFPAGDYEPRFSPDGQTLAFLRWGANGPGADICLKPRDGGAVRCIMPPDKQWPVRDFAWAPGGDSVIVSVDGLLRVPVSGGPVERLAFGDDAYNVAAAANGDRFVFERFTQDSNLWRVPGPAAAVSGEAEPLIGSTRAELLPRYSPDGNRIAFVSGRTGGWEVWVSDADGSNPRRLTDWGFAAYPDWSPDGRLIAFSSGRYAVGRGGAATADVGFDPDETFLVEAAGGLPRMISDGESGATAPSWSADGRYVFFTRGYSGCGSGELWRRHLDSGEERRLAACASRPLAAADGRVYYYDKRARGIGSLPPSGGDPRLELSFEGSCHPLGSAWTVWQSSLVYVDCQDLAIRILDLDTRETRELARPLEREQLFEYLSLDVSPDGQWVLFSRVDRVSSDLVLVEPFQ